MDQQSLTKYIEAVRQLQENNEHRINENDFQSLVGGLGYSSTELKDIEAEFDTIFKRAANYYRSENYAESVRLLEQALAIKPFYLSAYILMADSYKMLFVQTQDPQYYEQCIIYCRRGLEIQSFNEYFTRVETRIQLLSNPSQSFRKARWILGFIGVLLVGGFVAELAEQAISPLIGLATHTISVLLLLGSVVLIAWFVWKWLQYQWAKKYLLEVKIALKFVPK